MTRNNTSQTIICVISCAGTPKNIIVLKKCVASIRKALIKDINLSIVVTTNNVDHCIDKKSLLIQDVIVSEKRVGFVGINNAAVDKTIQKKSFYYLIINDDAWIDKHFFQNLIGFLKNKASLPSIIVPLIYGVGDEDIDSFGVEYFRTGFTKNSSRIRTQTTLASMSCLLIQTTFLKKMIQAYGYFLNPLLVWYLDDVDFSIRARAIGGVILKSSSLKAHHLRTYTWGRKSYLVMYYSFRNLIWIILTAWPVNIITKQLIRLFLWQLVVLTYCLIRFGPLLYIKIVYETIINIHTLLRCRRNTLKQYQRSFQFGSLFSSLEMRHDRLTF